MKILVINCGSSSLKYQVIDPVSQEVFCKGLCERIGIEGSKIEYKVPATGYEEEKTVPMPDHTKALELVISAITNSKNGVVKSVEEIDAIGHRVVHGGEDFANSVLVTDNVIEVIKKNSELAPLHNPANLLGIETCQKLMPGKPNVAVFDTAFHQSIPQEAFMYALPYEDYTELKVRKYGFHGTSHLFVSRAMREIMGFPPHSKIIVCHLGNGASISAVKDGKSIDTSMGLTPLQGLMMGTRCGDIDPAVVSFVKEKRNMTDKEMDDRLNKQSGILGIYGKSSDCRDLEGGVMEGDRRAILARDMFAYRIKTYIGAYTAIMGGLDAIVFTGGIGENSADIRYNVVMGLEYLGCKLDKKANLQREKGVQKLSTDDSQVFIYKIPTNEELVIAVDTHRIVNSLHDNAARDSELD